MQWLSLHYSLVETQPLHGDFWFETMRTHSSYIIILLTTIIKSPHAVVETQPLHGGLLVWNYENSFLVFFPVCMHHSKSTYEEGERVSYFILLCANTLCQCGQHYILRLQCLGRCMTTHSILVLIIAHQAFVVYSVTWPLYLAKGVCT